MNKLKEKSGDLKDACWAGYTAYGMKDKDGKKVPNCVKEIYEIYYESDGKVMVIPLNILMIIH